MYSQISFNAITLSWTPPLAPPSNGYQIAVDMENFDSVTMSSSENISVSLGVHTIRVQSRSIHFTGRIATIEVTVQGNGHACIIYS